MRKSTIIANILGFFLVSAIVIFAYYVESKEKPKAVEKVKQTKTVKLLPPVESGKPKLAIVIDDVGSFEEMEALKATGVKLTPAIFPPTTDFPDTPEIAKSVDEYLIHLPLQARHHDTPQEVTLHIDDSYYDIEREIKKIKKDFPDLKILNGHTGSAFTSHKGAMRRLFKVLKSQNILFLDSRTTKDTVALQIAKEYGMFVLERDVFIDNEPDVDYVLDNLKKAITTAKKQGVAIAIGHPRPYTIEALAKARSLFKDVELVYVRSLYKNGTR